MSKVEMGKQYVTESGQKVKILAVDVKQGKFPVIGIRENIPGGWIPDSWTEDGFHNLSKAEHEWNLVEVLQTAEPDKQEVETPKQELAEPKPPITMEGCYRTRGGSPVRILATDRKSQDRYSVVGLVTREAVEFPVIWQEDGSISRIGGISELDLVAYNEWDNVAIDTPVVCKWTVGGGIRHFAGLNELGQPLAWVDGCTSLTTDKAITWKSMRLATKEEIAERQKKCGDTGR